MTSTKILNQTEIFYGLTDIELELVASVCEERTYKVGELVFAENSRGHDLYVIVEGEVEIQIDPATIGVQTGSGPHTIARMRRGQSFGEVALVDEGVRSAAARCATHNTRLLVISRSRLMLLCNNSPELGFKVMRNLAEDLAMKIRNTDLQVREYVLWSSRREEP